MGKLIEAIYEKNICVNIIKNPNATKKRLLK